MLQVSKLYSLKKVSNPYRPLVWIKAAVSVAVIFYVIYSLKEARVHLVLLPELVLQKTKLWLPLMVAVLVPLNWSLEAVKWQYLLKKVEQVSFLESLAGVLSGLSFGFITPQSIGDYAGRVIRLRSSKRLFSLGALLISNFAQFYITLLGGTISLVYLMNYLQRPEAVVFTFFLAALNSALLFAFIYQRKALSLVREVKLLRPVYHFIAICNSYEQKQIICTLAVALLRYVTFSVQFVCMLLYLRVNLPLHLLFLGVSFVFLAKSVLPVLNSIGDLGVREATALFFFGFFGVAPEKVVLASLVIWLVNIVLPSLAGLGVVLTTKINQKC